MNTEELLLACLQEGPTPEVARLSPTAWEQLIQEAIRLGVAPRLYGVVKDHPLPEKLRSIYLSSAARNIRLYHELSAVLGALQEAAIPVIVLKGAYLAEAVYGNIALRPMDDLDLLLHQSDLALAERKLLDLGYRSTRTLEIAEECMLHHHLPGLTKAGTAPLEIHWHITRPTGPFQMGVEGLWQRAHPVSIAGKQVLALSPEDLLLHLCLHILHDEFVVGLRPLCDVAEILRHDRHPLHWDALAGRAKQWGLNKCLYLVLSLSRELVGASVSDEQLSIFAPTDLDPRFILYARERIFLERQASLPLAPNLARLSRAGRLPDKIVTLLQLAFPSPRSLAAGYRLSPSSRWLYLYYLVRLKDLTIRHGPALRRLWGRDTKLLASERPDDRGNTLIAWLTSL
jgi:hypothetical protein